jgi:hypothetical protein
MLLKNISVKVFLALVIKDSLERSIKLSWCPALETAWANCKTLFIKAPLHIPPYIGVANVI